MSEALAIVQAHTYHSMNTDQQHAYSNNAVQTLGKLSNQGTTQTLRVSQIRRERATCTFYHLMLNTSSSIPFSFTYLLLFTFPLAFFFHGSRAALSVSAPSRARIRTRHVDSPNGYHLLSYNKPRKKADMETSFTSLVRFSVKEKRCTN